MKRERLLTVLVTITAVLTVQSAIAMVSPSSARAPERATDAEIVRAIEGLGRDYLRDMETSLDAVESSTGELAKELARYPGIRRELDEIEAKLAEILAELKAQ